MEDADGSGSVGMLGEKEDAVRGMWVAAAQSVTAMTGWKASKLEQAKAGKDEWGEMIIGSPSKPPRETTGGDSPPASPGGASAGASQAIPGSGRR